MTRRGYDQFGGGGGTGVTVGARVRRYGHPPSLLVLLYLCLSPRELVLYDGKEGERVGGGGGGQGVARIFVVQENNPTQSILDFVP